MSASQDSAWHTFESHEPEAMGCIQGGEPLKQQSTGEYDEQVTVSARNVSLQGYPYLIKKPDGQTICGRADGNGHLPRIHTNSADAYEIHWGDEALSHEGWSNAE
ncbi:hypothetical protein PWP93_31585 [Paraburkholderia sp. A1RI-2L]|uniref:hypothetical protein n=1 Tax=Paraburkholderia sp. A1RI-2L TaxID=3028367 RepID=UPI003B78C79C